LIPFADAEVRRRSLPVVNLLLIALNALVFFYEVQLGGLELLIGDANLSISTFFYKWGFIPQELIRGEPFTDLRVGLASAINIQSPIPTWATIFTSMFIHGGLLHFAGNMLFLWVFGDNIENRLGHLKYLVFYLAAGVAATLSHLAVDPHSQTPLVGASGAISGVMGAYLVLYPFNRIKALLIFYFVTVVRLPAVLMLGFWFLLQLLNAVGSVGLADQVNVAFFAHVGGFLAGMVIGGVYRLLPGQPRWPAHLRPPRH
jgi:membrane associated rhomboid family serine protease